jgi:predicted ABC-type ATPase
VTAPLLIVLAGPNGSGKSTLCGLPAFKTILERRDVTVINPDDIARQAPPDSNALIWSGRKVHELTETLILNKKSFLVETTLSGRNHFKTVERAIAAGYETALHFVFVSDLDLAKRRVRIRVELGGHNVPEIDQERRYGKSLSHAAELIGIVDHALIYCNDFRLRNHELIATYQSGKKLHSTANLPNWLP